MNHCLLEAKVQQAPTIRYTQDNKTPIAEMIVSFEGLRLDDPLSEIKVIGWGNLAQDLQSNIQVGQRIVIEGRLRMNTVPRQDGTKEKQAEFTLSRIHPISQNSSKSSVSNNSPIKNPVEQQSQTPQNSPSSDNDVSWNSAPLIPDTDDIPF